MIKSVMVDGAEALKLMVDGKLAWERGGLPAGYRRCDYLESTGTQFIDTLFRPNPANTKIEFEFTSFVRLIGTRGLIGTRRKADYFDKESFNMFQCVSNGTSIRIDIINGKTYTPTLLERTKCIIDGVNRIIKFNDTVFENETFNLNGGMRTNDTFKIFNFDTGGSITFDGAIIRFHSFSMLEDGIPVVDFVPCLDSSGIPCMYDTVSKKPFYNQGTGEFLYELA